MRTDNGNPSPVQSGPATRCAGLGLRAIAMFYDALLVLAVLFLLTGIVVSARHLRAIAPGEPLWQCTLLAAMYVYFGWFWTHGGQTLGMRAWRLRVVNEDGTGLSWRQSALRFLGALACWGTLGLGYLWALFEPRRRAWSDLLSGSLVLRMAPPPPPRGAQRENGAPATDVPASRITPPE